MDLRRRAPLIAAAVLLTASFNCERACSQDEAFYVGDQAPPMMGGGPNLPSLGRTGAASPSQRALWTQPAPSAAPTEAPKRRGLFARLGWGDGEEEAADQAPPMAAAPQFYDPRVMPAEYSRSGAQDPQRGTSPQFRRTDSAPQGLLGGLFGGKKASAPKQQMPPQQMSGGPRPMAPRDQMAQRNQTTSRDQMAQRSQTAQRPATIPNSLPKSVAQNPRPAAGLPLGIPMPSTRRVASPSDRATNPMQQAGSPNLKADSEVEFVSDLPMPVGSVPRVSSTQAPGTPRGLVPNTLSPPAYVSSMQGEPAATARRTQTPRPMVRVAPNHKVAQAVVQQAPADSIASAKTVPPTQPMPLGMPTKPAPMARQPQRTVEVMPPTPTTPALETVTPSYVPQVTVQLPNPVPARAASVKQPSPRATALLTEAHQAAQNAQTEAGLNEVVQRCRHVLAIDQSTTTIAYANDLGAWALNRRGELKADAGRVEEAMVDFDDALRMDPKRWRAVHNRGVLLAQRGAFAEAFEAFNRTIALNPEFAKPYSNRAALYVQAGDLQAAMRDFERAIALDPDLAVAHKGRGRVCHMLGRTDEALQHFDAAMILSPADAQGAASRADLLMDMGRYAQAIEGYRQAISLDPQLPSAYRNLAWLQATCPDPAHRNGVEAVANATRAIELTPQVDDISLDTLAAAQASAGEFQAAVKTLEQAIQMSPTADTAAYNQRLELYKSGRAFTLEPVVPVRTASFVK